MFNICGTSRNPLSLIDAFTLFPAHLPHSALQYFPFAVVKFSARFVELCANNEFSEMCRKDHVDWTA